MWQHGGDSQGGQAEFVALLRGLEEEGRTVLLTSHRVEEVRALASRVVVLDEGRVVASGSVEEICFEVASCA